MRQSPSRNFRALRLALVLGAAAPAALVPVATASVAQAQATYPGGYGAQQTPYPGGYRTQQTPYPGGYGQQAPYPGGYGAQPAPRQDAAAQAWAQILARTPQSNDYALNQRVRTVGDRLVRAAGADPRGWDYRVFSDNSPNAFVLPGGRVGVNTGLFRVIQNDDQLAAVLGHEIAHNQFNHAAQRSQRKGLAQLGLSIGARVFGRGDPELANRIARLGGAGAQLGFLLPFSRRQELEADRLGVDYMARAGFRPSQAVALWRNFQSTRGSASAPQFLSTHPNDATRIQQLEAYLRTRGYN